MYKKIVFLASGNGGNLKFFHHAKSVFNSSYQLFVVADRPCGAYNFGVKTKIESHIINYSRNNAQALQNVLFNIQPDLIITNWHKIIDTDTVEQFRGKMINLHYSILPAFGGLIGIEPLKKAFEKGCKFVGATCHYVDKEVDSGLILSQAILKVEQSFEATTNTVFQLGCQILFNTALTILNIDCHSFGPSFEQRHGISNVLFAPNLIFDATRLNNSFWEKLTLR